MASFNSRLYKPGTSSGGSGTGFDVVDNGTAAVSGTDTVTVVFTETFTDTSKMILDYNTDVAGVVLSELVMTTAGFTATLSASMTGNFKWRVTQTQ